MPGGNLPTGDSRIACCIQFDGDPYMTVQGLARANPDRPV